MVGVALDHRYRTVVGHIGSFVAAPTTFDVLFLTGLQRTRARPESWLQELSPQTNADLVADEARETGAAAEAGL